MFYGLHTDQLLVAIIHGLRAFSNTSLSSVILQMACTVYKLK